MSGCSSCGSTCAINEKPVFAAPEAVCQAAEGLGGLLADSAEFQALARWSRAVRLDPQVKALSAALQERRYAYTAGGDGADEGALEEQLEDLPVVRSFREAEAQARELFAAVDEAISQAAGLPFARLAKPAGGG